MEADGRGDQHRRELERRWVGDGDRAALLALLRLEITDLTPGALRGEPEPIGDFRAFPVRASVERVAANLGEEIVRIRQILVRRGIARLLPAAREAPERPPEFRIGDLVRTRDRIGPAEELPSPYRSLPAEFVLNRRSNLVGVVMELRPTRIGTIYVIRPPDNDPTRRPPSAYGEGELDRIGTFVLAPLPVGHPNRTDAESVLDRPCFRCGRRWPGHDDSEHLFDPGPP